MVRKVSGVAKDPSNRLIKGRECFTRGRRLNVTPHINTDSLVVCLLVCWSCLLVCEEGATSDWKDPLHTMFPSLRRLNTQVKRQLRRLTSSFQVRQLTTMYAHSLETSPMLTKSITAGVIAAVGNFSKP